MSERFFCPHVGCRRSFAELWRLKVHCRAPPDVRGSGRERGHGEELKHCPRCQASLQAGRHHVGCSKGPVAPRQAAKRMQVNYKGLQGRARERGAFILPAIRGGKGGCDFAQACELKPF